MFTIKVNSSYVVIRNVLLSVRLGNGGDSHPDNFPGKYINLFFNIGITIKISEDYRTSEIFYNNCSFESFSSITERLRNYNDFKKKKLQKVLVFLRFFKVPVIKYKYTENVKERGKEFIFL